MAFFILLYSVSQLTAQQIPFLKLSEDRGYLETENGEPFLWLGDTAWELVHRLNREEVILYLENRQAKEFTVIQTVILAEMDGLNTPNVYGHKPLIEKDPTRLNEEYFKHLDFVLSEAEKNDLYVGLLPAWGDKFNKRWGVGPEIFTPENAEEYGELLGKRYKDYPNIIWILGGDRVPENKQHYNVIRALAKGIQSEDQNHLISYHPSGAKLASDFFDESWLDIDMYQSGHSSLAKEYQYPQKSMEKTFKRPVINGEARYEDIPDRFWEEESYGRLDETDVRVSAYNSFLGGAAGYTYGSNDIWQMFDQGRIPTLNARLGWKKALDLPGAQQMKYLREFFNSLEWQQMKPAQELIKGSNPENSGHILAANAPQFALFYTPEGQSFQVDLTHLNFEDPKAYWFNPRTGTSKEAVKNELLKNDIFKPVSSGKGQDWLLVLLPKHKNFKLKKLQ
ncbi:glycoside hydrolase family 140 protein [Salinimicrobium sp. TH3]|uniref:glycoside hydrolase family 140 protein n=1 Tax=Salinimicrobium sp. TH3 TaxID=2997342 RepID=UPI0022763A83|nr:glycoside hydrolase family 140 protein [Salinimicrobium sp. TH3]MCY2685529.1 glycoside hydrolase family 140 protein [Salinimicrobium sp. TH3]